MEMCRITLVVLCTKYTHGFILIIELLEGTFYVKEIQKERFYTFPLSSKDIFLEVKELFE